MDPDVCLVVLLWGLLVGKGDCECYRETHLNICPFPAFIHAHKDNSLKISCKVAGIGILQKLGIGILEKTEHVETAYKCYRESPQYTDKRRRKKFDPASPNNLSDTDTTMTLNLEPLHLLDLTRTWYCEVQYKIRGDILTLFRIKQPVSLPYPSDATFAAYPTKSSYSRDEVVNLRCRGYSAMSFSKSTKLKVSFQRKQGSCWIDIDPNDTTQTEGIESEKQMLIGDFYHQTYILRLRVSSILGCRRRYRCLMSYKTRIFEEEAVELVIRATTCVGKEPYIEGCHTTTTDVAKINKKVTPEISAKGRYTEDPNDPNRKDPNDPNRKDPNDQNSKDPNATTAIVMKSSTESGTSQALFSVTSREMLIGVGIFSILLLILFALLFILACRRQKRKQKENNIRRSMAMSYKKELMGMGAATPVAAHELSSFQPSQASLSSHHSQAYDPRNSHGTEYSDYSSYSSHQ